MIVRTQAVEEELNAAGDSPEKKDTPGKNSPGSPDSPIAGDGKLMENEERKRGGVEADVYIYYLRQAGCLCILIVMAYILQQLAGVLNQVVMSRWTVFDTVIVVGYDDSWTQENMMNYFLALYATTATMSMLAGNITSVSANKNLAGMRCTIGTYGAPLPLRISCLVSWHEIRRGRKFSRRPTDAFV